MKGGVYRILTIYERKVDMVEPLKAVLISTPMGGLIKEKGRR